MHRLFLYFQSPSTMEPEQQLKIQHKAQYGACVFPLMQVLVFSSVFLGPDAVCLGLSEGSLMQTVDKFPRHTSIKSGICACHIFARPPKSSRALKKILSADIILVFLFFFETTACDKTRGCFVFLWS